MRVLFVCTANICRSPYMEAYARSKTSILSVESAGTHGYVDHSMDKVMAAELTNRGIDNTKFSSRRLTLALLQDADLVLTAERAHRAFILDDLPAAVRKVYTLGQFANAVGALEATGEELLTRVATHRSLATADDDVSDPYGQGPEPASLCAARMDALLDIVVPALAG